MIDIDLANEAILAVGARGQIANARENSNEARYVRAFWETTLNDLLRAAHWNFTRKTAFLSLMKSAPGTPTNTSAGTLVWDPATQPAPPWLFQYAYPADCIKMRFISPQIPNNALGGQLQIFSVPSYVPSPNYTLQPQRFLEIIDDALPSGEGPVKALLTNQYQAIGIYTRATDNPALWDARFRLAFINSLGTRLAIPLSGDKQMAASARAIAKEQVLDARVTDGNEGLTFAPLTQRPPDWIAVRGDAGDWAGGGYAFGGYDNPAYLLI